MAKKSFILSNDDSRISFSNTSSLSIDDGVGNNITANIISASNITLNNIPSTNTRVLSASNGSFSVFGTGSATNNGALVFNGIRWVTSSLQMLDYSGSAGGDLSGSYYENVKVTNISNISSGSLPVNYGGTGANIQSHKRNILKASGSIISTIPGYASGSVLMCEDGKWKAAMPSWKPDVQIFTTPGAYTWTKPKGARFAKIVAQGGGGAGANSYRISTTLGGGGSAGGYSDGVYDISNINSASIVVGAGGAIPTSISTTNLVGNAGGASIFSSNNINIIAYGGAGGVPNATTTVTGGSGIGAQTVKTGGSSFATDAARTTFYDVPGGGGYGRSSNGSTTARNYAAPISKILNIDGLHGINYNLISSEIPILAMTGGDGANPLLSDSSFYEDPYLLLHMKPIYEKRILPQTTSSYSPSITYNGSAGWVGNAPDSFTANSLHPLKYSINNTYNTGSIVITPGYALGANSAFTIEGFIYLNSYANSPVILDTRANSSTDTTGFVIQVNSSGKLVLAKASTTILTSSTTISTGLWTHFALVRTATNVYNFYINGNQDSNFATDIVNLSKATNIYLGNSSFSAQANPFNGFINNIKISNINKYSTSTYDIPTTDLLKDDNTILVFNTQEYDGANNITIDSSYYGCEAVLNNSAFLTKSVTAFGDIDYFLSPSGSNFTGSLTLINIPPLRDSNFTLEMWINCKGANQTASRNLFSNRNTAVPGAFTVALDTANRLTFTNGVLTLTGSTVPVNDWHHIALVRNNNIFKFYIDGTGSANTITSTQNFSEKQTHTIGANFNGFIDEVRLMPKALYIADFVPPTERFNDAYNPLVLLHMEPNNNNSKSTLDSSKFNNQVIFDNLVATTHADIVNKSNIENSVENPFGSGFSIGFASPSTASTGICLSGNNFVRRKNSFTLECWVYRKPTNVDLYPVFVNSSFGLYINTAGALYCSATPNTAGTTSGTSATSNLTVPLYKWTHIAVVRHGTNPYMSYFYVNGVKDTKSFTMNIDISSFTATIGANCFFVDLTYDPYWYHRHFDGYIDEFRISPSAIYTGSAITLPTQPFPDPVGKIISISSGRAGMWGSGGGGGGSVSADGTGTNPATHEFLQDYNKSYLGGKGGDGYVAVISW